MPIFLQNESFVIESWF